MEPKFSELVREFVAKKAEVDRLTTEVMDLRAKIMKLQGDKELICEDGIETRISYGSRSTLLEAEVKKLLPKIPESCYSVSRYPILKAKILAG